MADETRTSRDTIRAVIEEWNAVELTGCVGALWDRLAERIDRALFGDGSHEQSAAHWRANAASEKRKKQHVSELLSVAFRERDEARRDALNEHAELTALRREVVRVLRFSRNHGRDRDYIVQYGRGIRPSEVRRIAALLREPAEEVRHG